MRKKYDNRIVEYLLHLLLARRECVFDFCDFATLLDFESEDDLRAEISEISEGGLVRLYIFRPRAGRSFFAILRLDELE